MNYTRMPIEIESPEQMGYDQVKYNLTESSFRDARMNDIHLDLSKIILCYGDHLGHPELRKLLAKENSVEANDILLTIGAASALFIVATSLLKKGDRLLVLRPNYATNIETPRAIGAEIDFYDLTLNNGWRINVDEFIKRITPQTKLVSITTPHNPTGVLLSETDLKKIIAACKENQSVLLVDETYRDMAFGLKTPVAASLADHVITVSSLSKTYGLPGIRMGWLITRSPKLMEIFLAAKEQIFITGSMLDEEVAYQYLQKREQYMPAIQSRIEEHLKIVTAWFQKEQRMEWVKTEGGVVCFPRIRESAHVDVEKFYEILNQKYQTFVGPGHWFEQSRAHMRIGFGWPTTEELIQGLENISKALTEAKNL